MLLPVKKYYFILGTKITKIKIFLRLQKTFPYYTYGDNSEKESEFHFLRHWINSFDRTLRFSGAPDG